MIKEDIPLLPIQNTPSYASIYGSKEATAVIFYLHGGGLIFGNRDDLPEAYIDLLNKNNITIISLDYPLSPESKMDLIFDSLSQNINYILNHFFKENVPLYIMGRSSGAYLANLLSIKTSFSFEGTISLYGYYDIYDPYFSTPSSYSLSFSKVSLPKRFDSQVILDGKKDERMPIFIGLLQEGKWMDSIYSSESMKQNYNLKVRDLKKIKKAFIACSQDDPIIPSRQSIKMNQVISDSSFCLIDSHEHDFDRVDLDTGLKVYNKIVEWIKN